MSILIYEKYLSLSPFSIVLCMVTFVFVFAKGKGF